MPESDALWAGRSAISSREFARRVLRDTTENRGKYAFLIGAGASVSSGIPTASSLAEGWLQRLYEDRDEGPDKRDGGLTAALTWAQSRFDWRLEPDNLGRHYSVIVEELFRSRAARQREFHRICKGKQPHASYIALALLVGGEPAPTTERPPDAFNVVLTTNFDDLLTTALYRWAARRPRVISHSGLADFAADDLQDPLIVHLHGAYQTTPENTATELASLPRRLEQAMRELLARRELVVLGYSGNDPDISTLLGHLYKESQQGIHWVSRQRPTVPPELEAAIADAANSTWVRVESADEFLFELASAFDVDVSNQSTLVEEEQRIMNQWSSFVTRSTDPPAPDPGDDSAEIVTVAGPWPNATSAITAASRAHDRAEARRLWDAVLEQYPTNPWTLISAAVWHADAEQPDVAADLFERAKTIAPDHPGVLGNYGIFERRRGNLDAARSLYLAALRVDPRQPDILRNLAALELEAGNLVDAERFCDRALQAEPSNADTLHVAGLIQEAVPNLSRATRYLAAAVDARPDDAVLVGDLARIRARDQAWESARELFQRSYELDPTLETTIANFGAMLAESGRYGEAAPKLERAIELYPTNRQMRALLAYVELQRGERERALELAREVVADKDAESETLANAAAVLYEAGAAGEAESTLWRAVETSPPHANAMVNLAAVLLIGGDHERAREYATQALELSSSAMVTAEANLYLWILSPQSRAAPYRDAVQAALAEGVRSGEYGIPLEAARTTDLDRADRAEIIDAAERLASVPDDRGSR